MNQYLKRLFHLHNISIRNKVYQIRINSQRNKANNYQFYTLLNKLKWQYFHTICSNSPIMICENIVILQCIIVKCGLGLQQPHHKTDFINGKKQYFYE